MLEVYIPGTADIETAQPTHVVVFECKDHGRNVQVETVEAIIGKKQASFDFAIKFHIVTRKGFAPKAMNLARANGIGLIKIMPDDKVHHVMYHMTPDMFGALKAGFAARARKALVDPDHESEWDNFYGCDDDRAFETLTAMLEHGARG